MSAQAQEFQIPDGKTLLVDIFPITFFCACISLFQIPDGKTLLVDPNGISGNCILYWLFQIPDGKTLLVDWPQYMQDACKEDGFRSLTGKPS